MLVYKALYWLYFCVAAMSIGMIAFSGILNTILMIKCNLGLNSIAFFRICLSAGYVLVVGTILWLALPAAQTGIQPSLYYWSYMAGLLFSGAGAIGLSLKNIKIHVEMTAKMTDDPDVHIDGKETP